MPPARTTLKLAIAEIQKRDAQLAGLTSHSGSWEEDQQTAALPEQLTMLSKQLLQGSDVLLHAGMGRQAVTAHELHAYD